MHEFASPAIILKETLFLLFHRSSQPFDAAKSRIFTSLAKKNAFSFRIIPFIGMFWLLADKNHLYTHCSRLSLPTVFLLSFFGFFPISKVLRSFSLFFIPVDTVFRGTPYFSATSLFETPFSMSFSASYLSFKPAFSLTHV